MTKLRHLLIALALIGASVAPSWAQGVERAHNQSPFFTSDSWFRAATTPTDCTAPQYSFTGDTDTGMSYGGGDTLRLCAGGSQGLIVTASQLSLRSTNTTRWNVDASGHFMANVDNTYDIGAVGATRPRSVYAGTDVAASRFIASTGTATTSGYAFGSSTGFMQSSANGVFLFTNAAGSDFSRLQFGGTTSSFPSLKRSGTALQAKLADDSAYTGFEAFSFQSTDANITVASGTGITLATQGQLRRQVYKVTVANTAFTCAALTCDVTIATLPTKTAMLSVYADLTQVFACSSVCTSSTLSMTSGWTAGTTELLLSFDVDAAITVRGNSDAHLGTALARASATQGGAISFTGANLVSLRLTSGTGNIGTGAATNLSTGSITFYLVTERFP